MTVPTRRGLHTFWGFDQEGDFDGWFEVVEWGPPDALPDGTPFAKWAEFHWSRVNLPDLDSEPTPEAVLERSVTMKERPEVEKYFAGPLVSFRLALHDGRSEVDEVCVQRRTGDPEVNLRDIPLSRIAHDATEGFGSLMKLYALVREDRLPPSDSDRADDVVKAMRNAGKAAAATRGRRKMTDDLLREVAEVYLADTSGAPTQAVADHFYTGHRNATRYVAKARERGFINQTEDKS